MEEESGVGKVVLKPSPRGGGEYNWKCPKCNGGHFSWSRKINEQWGHPEDKAFCAVCFVYHDIKVGGEEITKG